MFLENGYATMKKHRSVSNRKIPRVHKRKMEERKVRQERKEFQHRYFYYIAVITTAGGNKKTVLCRDNKYYKTYYDQEDGWFKAHPNYRIDKVVQTFDSLEEALQIYKS